MNPPQRPFPRSIRYFVAGALGLAAVGLLFLAGLLDLPRSEPAARRLLMQRAAELSSWMTLELLAPTERGAFAEEGGVADSAPPWREILRRVEGAARGPNPELPELAVEPALAETIGLAIGASHCALFTSTDDVLRNDVLRQTQVFARLLERQAPVDPAWLDAAIALAFDLRSTGLVAPALGAADLEAVVARSLSRPHVGDTAGLERLALHAGAARAQLPPPMFVAQRETRVLQAFLCARADVPPFHRSSVGAGDGDSEPPLPLIDAEAGLVRLDGLAGGLAAVLDPAPDPSIDPGAGAGRAAVEWDASIRGFARAVPGLAAFLPTAGALAPICHAGDRLAAIEQAAQLLAAAASGPGLLPR